MICQYIPSTHEGAFSDMPLSWKANKNIQKHSTGAGYFQSMLDIVYVKMDWK